jgi:TPR repeat protein
MKNDYGFAHAGLRYYKGDGVNKDESKAVRWYAAAAAQGHAQSQYHLGTFISEPFRIVVETTVFV